MKAKSKRYQTLCYTKRRPSKSRKKPNGNGGNGNGREKLIATVTRLDNLIREIREYGPKNSDIQARMKELVGVEKRADLNEAQMEICIEAFGDWANELYVEKHGEGEDAS